MKRYISICILWMFCLTILGQSNGYGFNPINPPNPNKPVVSNKKYELKITSSGGGSINNSSSANYEVGENIYLSASPQTGYKFKCWLIGDSVISISQWYYFTMPAKKTEIKAEFVYEPDSPNNPNIIKLSYKVTVKALSQGGTVYCSNEKVKEGTTTYVSATPYTGYKFTGWYLDGKLVSNSSHYYFEMEGRQMDFTAQFEVAPFNPDNPINPNNNPNNQPLYIIEYKIDGELCHIGQIPGGATIAAISTPVKEGHTFSGWNGLPTTMPSSNITVNGTFTVNYYNLSYSVDGEIVATNKIAYGSTINLIDVAEKEGHTFSGWRDVPKTMPAKDITISGAYQVNSYKIIYKVDDVAYDSTEVTYGSPVTLIATPEKEGHTFSGWSEAPETMPAKDITISGTFSVNSYKITWKIDGEEKQVDTINYGTAIVPPTSFEKEGYQLYWSNKPDSMPAMDIVVDGTYSLRKYLVTYIANDSTIATDSIAFGSKIEQINAPDKEGYTFIGWAEVPEAMPAKDIVLTAKYSVNKYTIKYIIGEDVIETVTVEYGSTIEFIEEPTKEGYTFSGWSCEYTTMPAKDIVVNGSYNAKSYTITYKVDDKEYKTENVAFETKIQLIEAPTKEGYTFSGWSEAPETMPAKDITISGTFTVNSYKVTYMVDGVEYKTVNVNYGEKIVLIDAPAKDGFTFSGWTDAPETMPAKDITISGTFGVNSYKVTYMVDGKEYQSVSLAYGSTITLIDAPTKEGHTFSGWSEAPETMPAKDITISGTFSVNSYKVTYMVDGAEFKTVNINFGEKIELIAAPIKNGFTFSGWSEAPETMPAKDIVINGSFGVNSYKVTYMVDGKEYQSVSLAYGSAITLIDAPTKEGHTFSGWSEAPATMPAKDITISGTFSVNSYKITYKVDGTEYKTVNVNFGEKIVLIDAPAKDGFTFSGWTDAPETMPAKDIVINGSFGVNSYKVTYMVDGKEYQSVSLAYGSAITLIDAPTKDGFTFSGWSEAPETMPAKDIVINGSFTVNSYKVTYKVDGAEYKTVNVYFGEKIVLIAAPTKDGFTFSGWTDAPDVMPAKDIVINGKFLTNAYTITYMVDGKEYRTIQVSYGEKIQLIEAPTKEGHSFSGWSEVPETMPAKDITISGSFTVNSYKVTYKVDGAEYKTVNVNFGEKIELIAAPTKNGFTFSGWSEAPETMPAKDIIISGTFSVNSYKITYMVDGKEYQSVSLAYGSAITLIEAPTKEGHTFSGWSEAPETMPAKDITINGSFAVNSYKVTYKVDGADYKTVNVNFGEKIVLIDAPAKDGYTFSGWTDAPDVMPAKDIVINGKFLTNAYSVTYMVDGKEYRTIQVSYGEKIQLIDAPTKEGHTFSGWSEAPESMPAKDITISGTFSVNSYKITYMVDGAEFKTVNVNFGEKVELIAAPTKNGFTFSGWSEAPETMPAKDIVINGSFGVNSYKVTYMVDGKEYQSVSLAYGSAITLIDAPTKEGHTFSGWSEAPETMPAKDIVINGSFTVNSYKVTYKVDGTEYKTVNVNFGEKIVLIDAPAKDGYTFSGWTDAPDVMPAKDIVINGKFLTNAYSVTYMVDDKEYRTIQVSYGAKIELIGAPDKEGHTFSGWGEVPETMPAKDIILTAEYSVNKYTIKYVIGDEVIKTVTVAYNSTIELIEEQTKEGHTFSGWGCEYTTMPAKDIIITGTFSVNYYTLTYIVDGDVYKEEQVSYGSEIVLIDAPIKEDYIFSGWSDYPATMPAENVTITGSFVHTSISGISADAIVKISGNSITLSGANNNTIVIYTTNGALVEKIDCYAGEEILLNKGVYIISIGGKVVKIRL